MKRSMPTRDCFPSSVTIAITGLLLLTGCTGKAIEEIQLETKSKAEAAQAARIQAQAVADLASKPLDRWTTSTAPCIGIRGEMPADGRWNLAGFANISVPADEQIDILARIRNMWEQRGYEIIIDQTLSNEQGGVLSTRDPKSGITMTISASKDGERLALTVTTPCYLPIPGEDPANDF